MCVVKGAGRCGEGTKVRVLKGLRKVGGNIGTSCSTRIQPLASIVGETAPLPFALLGGLMRRRGAGEQHQRELKTACQDFQVMQHAVDQMQ